MSQSYTKNEDRAGLIIKIATGKGTGNSITHQELPWRDFAQQLSVATVDQITQREYLELVREERLRYKASRGYYIMAEMSGNRRNNTAVVNRTGATIDIEGANVDAAAVQAVLKEYEWHLHATRSSTPQDRRYRITLPYATPVQPHIHEQIAKRLCDTLEWYGISVDRQASVTVSQPAFFPTISSDQPFEHVYNQGTLLNPETYLELDALPAPSSPETPVLLDVRVQENITTEELWQALSYLAERAEGYHQWIEVGLALYHQYSGGYQGLELWDRFSQLAPGAYKGYDDVAAKWDTLNSLNTRTITVRSILHWARGEGWHRGAADQQTVLELEPSRFTVLPADEIPPRRWILGRRLMRGYLSMELAPGGVGKSLLSLLTAVSICTGQSLTGETVHEPGKVWVINWEDDLDELQRRLHAIVVKYDLSWDLIEANLHLDSWYGHRRLLAVDTPDGVVPTKAAEHLADAIKERDIHTVILDPFVSIHNAQENDNGAMDAVTYVLRRIAAKTSASIMMIHHTPKGSGFNSEAHAGSSDAGRGASALINAARHAYTLARMSAATAEEYLIPEGEHVRYIRHDNAKSNQSLPDPYAHWYRLETVTLLNGDDVGVPVPFDLEAWHQEARARRDTEQREARREEIQEYQIQIVECMDNDDEPRRRVQETIAPRWQIQRTQLDERFEFAVPHREEFAEQVTVHGQVWRLWRDKGPGVTSPWIIHRRRV